MMTRKDFRIFAEEFAYAHRYQIGGPITATQEIMFEAFCIACRRINPNFNEEVWFDYFSKGVQQ